MTRALDLFSAAGHGTGRDAIDLLVWGVERIFAGDDVRAEVRDAIYLDCCPECCVNLEAPQAAMRVGDGWHCEYLCGRCGHAWTTDWRN